MAVGGTDMFDEVFSTVVNFASVVVCLFVDRLCVVVGIEVAVFRNVGGTFVVVVGIEVAVFLAVDGTVVVVGIVAVVVCIGVVAVVVVVAVIDYCT